MKITLAPGHVYLKIEEVKAGVLNTSSRESAVENGTVLEVASDVDFPKKGDKVLFKAWGTDIINFEGKKYYIVDMQTRSIKAVIK